jgi:lysophospholipase L1-like esterase
MKTDVIDLHPRALLILAGTNDIARGTPIDIIEDNLILMAELAREHQIKVLIASVLPVSEARTERPIQTIQQLNSWIEQYCKQTGATYVDYSAKLRGPGGYLQGDLADDGLHPNSQGYRLMAPVAISAIDGALGRSTTPVETERRRRVHVF